MEKLRHDLRQGLRMLSKKPAFTFLAVLILALGIGANTAIFSVINGLLLQPLPYPDSERLVSVWNKYPLMNLPRASNSVPDYLDRRQQVTSFEETCLYFFQSFNLSFGDRPERIVGIGATASMFPLLQSEARLGRVFGEEEDQPGRENVVVLSHSLWKGVFGEDESIVGRDIRLNGTPHQVIGVMGPEFQFPHPRVQLWKPFAFTDQQKSDASRGREFARMMGRLQPGASVERAQSEIDAIHQANKERFPEGRVFWENSGFGGLVVLYREDLFGQLRPMLMVLQLMVLVVLLIACANVANLLLTRVHARNRELSLRVALGAGRWRLVRQLLTESVMLSFLGGALGILVGFGCIRLLLWMGVDETTRGIEVGIDGGVLLFALFLSFVTGCVFGLFPILTLRSTNPAQVIKEGGPNNTSGRGGAVMRGFLVVSEVTLAIFVLVCMGLLGRSFINLQNENPGFNSQNIALAQVTLPSSKYPDDAKMSAFYDSALGRLRSLPGVRSAGVISAAPFSGNSSSRSYQIEGYTTGEGESAPHALFRVADPDYFKTLEIPLVKGRIFETSDNPDGIRVAVVDQILVDKYFPNEDPIGRRIGGGGSMFTIVGVVDKVKIGTLDQPVTKETVYVPYKQSPNRGMTFVIKTGVPPSTLTKAIREAILRVDGEQPVFNIVTMDKQLSDNLRNERVSVTILVVFAAIAVVLASAGLYGVLSFSVGQRTREMGTRIALGAESKDILGLILKQGMFLTLLGVVVGVAASLILSRYLSTILFGVAPWDPLTFAVVSGMLVLVALMACYFPARRAMRVSPIQALRYE